MGVLVEEAVPAGEVLYRIKAMVDTFCAHGNYENRAKARTRYMQETLGPDGLREVFLSNVAAAKAAGGLDLEVVPTEVEKAGDGEVSAPRALPQKQPGLYAVQYPQSDCRRGRQDPGRDGGRRRDGVCAQCCLHRRFHLPAGRPGQPEAPAGRCGGGTGGWTA